MERRLTDQQREEIFSKEFLPHIDALHTFAYHLTLDDHDASDLVQETYLKAFRFIDSYHEGTYAKAWLFKILKNAFINGYRQKSRTPPTQDYEEVLRQQTAGGSNSKAYADLREDIYHDEVGDEISQALNQMPVEFRTIILLSDLEDFSYEEISKILEVPVGTVRSRLHRARNMLKIKLKKYAQELGYEDKRSKKREKN